MTYDNTKKIILATILILIIGIIVMPGKLEFRIDTSESLAYEANFSEYTIALNDYYEKGDNHAVQAGMLKERRHGLESSRETLSHNRLSEYIEKLNADIAASNAEGKLLKEEGTRLNEWYIQLEKEKKNI